MKWAGYGWAAFTEFISVAIAFAVVSAFSSQFERIVIDLLVLTYVAVRSAIQTNGWIAVEEGKLARDRFLELMKAVGSDRYETEESKQDRREGDARLERQMIKGFIHAAGMMLIAAFTILNLLTAL